MGDFLALLLELVLDAIISKFEFISHPIARGVVQIVAMIVACTLVIACVILVVNLIKWLRSC